MIKQKLQQLRKLMRDNKIDAYYISGDDTHHSEYVCAHFQTRQFLSGFTGSAGKMVITPNHAGLWTDGRYFIQAQQQLQGSEIKLYKQRQPNVPTILQYLQDTLTKDQTLGFDGKTVSAEAASEFQQAGLNVNPNIDLIEQIWENRPPLPCTKAFLLDTTYSGTSTAEKLADIRRKCTADVYITTALDEIAWLLNIRAADVAYNPVFLAYCAIEKDSVKLFTDARHFDSQLLEYLHTLDVQLDDYDRFYTYINNLNQSVMLDKSKTNCAAVRDGFIDKNLIAPCKAVKNKTEIENERRAHIKDGVACTKFLYWLKTTKEKITELSAAEKLEQLRSQSKNYLGQSFAPIVAYNAHGAIVHYSATQESCAEIHDGLTLIDTGGHYLEGTTDITRTVALGTLSQKQKEHYTLVLQANLALAELIFRTGKTGRELDCIARQKLWKYGLDYNHGTGHGVGYLLNVHEDPVSFSKDCIFEPGMITSNEPGLYFENEYGIRLENMMVCVKRDDLFYAFEVLTMCPFDLDVVLPEMMNEHEKQLLNNYHHTVRQTLLPFLDKKTAAWLTHATREI